MTLKEATEALAAAGVADPLSDARRIFAELGGVSRHDLFSPAVSTDREEAVSAVARRAKREPLQYILGEAYFYRERYKVTPDCLIPREDTELLVDFAVKNLPRGALFIDLCTGSGCVALSVLNNTRDTRAIMVDLSPGALSVARENAVALGLDGRAELRLCDATEPFDCGEIFAVLSNPPYVSSSAYEKLEKEIYFEPSMAFLGGEDGADFYRKITSIYRDKIAKDGFIAYEIGYDQGELIKEIADATRMTATVCKDLSGNDRLAVLRVTDRE